MLKDKLITCNNFAPLGKDNFNVKTPDWLGDMFVTFEFF